MTVSFPPYCGVLAAGVVVVLLVTTEVVVVVFVTEAVVVVFVTEVVEVDVDVLLQEVSAEAEIRDATSIKLKPKNRIFLFTSFSPYIFSWCFSFYCPKLIIDA
jgi:hypothetical protein